MSINDRDDVGAQLAVEGRLIGWQVYRTHERRWSRGVEIPATDLAELKRLRAERTPPEHSVMRELLGEEAADRHEIAPGRWYLPRTPP